MKLLALFALTCSQLFAADHGYQSGDIIFHTSRTTQSQAIQSATGSRYSHMGILFYKDGAPFVFEAAGTVKLTPLTEWIDRGVDGHYVVKRLSDAGEKLTPEVLLKLKSESKKFAGLPYDYTFEWSDDKIYCSELVWKLYKRAADIEIGPLAKLGSFDLTSPEAQAILKQRYPAGPPLAETVISPASIFSSDALIEVGRK